MRLLPRLPLLMPAIGLSLALTACSGGGGGSGAPLDQKSTLTTEEVDHLLTRTHLGITAEARARVEQLGPEAFLDELLTFTVDPALEQAALGEIEDLDFPRSTELVQWWLHVMVRTTNPLQEQLALFWHDHFATSQSVLDQAERHWMLKHVNLLRREGAGNLKTLVYALATDPVMLDWLDGVRSTDRAPNENFARELWELFTLGADNGYTQEDIEEAARCFTGFRRRVDPDTNKAFVEFDPDRHDTEQKLVLGQIIAGREGADGALEYRDVVDVTFAHRPVAEYICRSLWEYFVYPDPEPKVVDELALTLRESDWELRPVLKRIFLARAFYSPRAREGLVKSPVEHIVGFVRSTGLEVPFSTLRSRLGNADQQPTLPPGVEGWPRGEGWLSAQAVVERANLLRECVVQRSHQEDLGRDITELLPGGGAAEDTVVLSAVAGLLGLTPSEAEMTELVDYLNTDRDRDGMTFTDPFDGTDPGQVDKKIRGLFWILGQHPRYYLR